MIRDDLAGEIKQALGALGLNIDKLTLERPGDLANGDYSCNVALILAKQTGSNSRELANTIAEKISENKHEYIEKVEVAGPGFINFYLSPKFYADSVKEVLEKKDRFGQGSHVAGMKALVEYTQPNPFKEFHIGHLMNNVIGESLSRIIGGNGAEVKRCSYHGDVGMHVAKTIYGLLKLGPDRLDVAVLGRAYALGNEAFETDAAAKQEITELNMKVYNRSDAVINQLYDEGKRVSLDHFESIYARLGTKFDYNFFESESAPIGKEIVLNNIDNGIFEKSDGAVVYRGERHGLHTRVFLNAEGLPTYEAKELGLLQLKREKYHFDFGVTVTANEQDSFFKVVEQAIAELYPEYSGKVRHVSHGVLKLPSGKMSSRTGTIVTAVSLLDDVKARVTAKMADRELSDGEKDQIAESVAQAAIRYSILKQAAGKDIIFDFEKSLSFEGDSGPYLQYAHTRTQSVIEKAKDAGIMARVGDEAEINELIRLVYRLPEVVERAGEELAPHHLATYLIELASAFNAWYGQNRIIDPANQNLSSERLALTAAVGQVLNNGLSLLGISAPDKM